MHLRYDDDFLEGAVFLCASGRCPGATALQVRRFHMERERCYAVADPDQRNAAFFQVHLGWFREWGLEQLLVGVLEEYPLLSRALTILALRQARNKNEEAAELYVTPNGVHNAMLALRLRRLEHRSSLLRFLRHECMHLHDMVDPAFGYSRHLPLAARNQTQERIIRERYRLLWDITIDGRLTRQERETETVREQHWVLFERAFSFWPEEKRRQVFEGHWNGPAPSHANLLALAADPRELGQAQTQLPGSSCPLCDFPTFEWADASGLGAETLSVLRLNFPAWNPLQGVCRRCVEIYELSGKLEMPATTIR